MAELRKTSQYKRHYYKEVYKILQIKNGKKNKIATKTN